MRPWRKTRHNGKLHIGKPNDSIRLLTGHYWDKVYKRKNLEMAWGKVRSNRGSGGVGGKNLEEFVVELDQQLDQLHRELKGDTYQPRPVRQVQIPKVGKPGEYRMLGIPTIYDRVCQQAPLNRIEPIFEPVFDEANFGYRRGRSTQDAMRKVWKEIQGESEWIADGERLRGLSIYRVATITAGLTVTSWASIA